MFKEHSTRLGYADLVVDAPDDFQVHTSVYTDPQIFAAELANIFEVGRRPYPVVLPHEQCPRPIFPACPNLPPCHTIASL